MTGSIEFTPPYQDGWQDNEEGATPITADILNNNYDAFLVLLNAWIGNIEEELVAVPDFQISSPSSGQVLKFNGSKWVNAAESGGGSDVSWNQIVQTGTQIASITINGTSYAVYAPSGGSSVSINRKTTTGTNIADITIDGVTTQLFAPNGGSGGASSLNELSDVTLANLANGQVLQYNSNTSKWENKSISVGDSVEFTQILSSGVKIGTITIDGTDYDIYAPKGGGGGFEPNGDSYRIVSSKDGSDTVLSLEYYEDGSQSAVEMKMCEAGSSFTQDFHNLHLVSNGTTVSVSSKIDSIRFNDDIFNENDEIFSVTIGSASATYSDIEEGTYTPGGGSTVSWTQTQQSGTKIAEISIDGVSQNVYVPTPYKEITGILTAGQTSITLNDSSILENSTFDFYTSKFGVNPIDVELTISKIKVLRQELVTQESELDVSVTANSSWSGYEAWKAFLSSGGAWIGDGGNPHWLQVEFDSIISIREMDFVSVDSSRSHPISRIGYSNDGVNFNECGILNSTMINDVGHCELDNDYEAKYFRIYFDGDYGLSSYPCMSQLEIYGYDEDPQRQKSITLTFEAQSENLNVKVRVS